MYPSYDAIDEDNPMDLLAVDLAGRSIENIYLKTPPGIPEHELNLKVGAIMMIIKNINVAQGLCNGTRVQIMELGEHIIKCRYVQGPRAGKIFDLHRHLFFYGGTGRQVAQHGTVKWSRLQFPLRPGFVMTTHKSQGRLFIIFYILKTSITL